ncbi:hypothetical protein EPO15_05695, partial [bacterium]
MLLTPLVLLLSASLPSLSAAESVRVQAAATLAGDLGPGVAALERRGLLITSGDSKPARLLDVAWEPLGRAAASAKRLTEFLAAYDAARKGSDPADPADAFSDLRAVAPGGLLSEPVRAALAALSARASARAALGDAAPALLKKGSAYGTSWGRGLRDGGSAELFALLSGPKPSSDASRHVAAWASAVGRGGFPAALEAGRADGAPSAGLAEDLAAYLADQASLEALAAASERLAKLERDSDARLALGDVRAAAPKLAEAPDLTERLKEILAAADEPGSVKLTAPELHARSEDGSAFEPDDKAVFSIAYWVDGLGKGEQTDVVEALYLDQGSQGLTLVRRDAHKRAAGGPYVVNVEAAVPAAGRLTYRLVLDSADGAPLSREASVPVSEALDALRAAAGRAEGLARACRLAESTAAWHEVLAGLDEQKSAARTKLASEVKARLRAAEAWAREKADLGESLDGARLYATPERCEYRTDRAERALKLLAGLPAGCDRGEGGASGVAAELSGLARVTDSRRRLQEGFRASLKKARDAESSCRPADAARLYASALALLDSDTGARCGELEGEYQTVRLSDLPRVAGAERLSGAVEGELAKARKRFSAGDPPAALAILLPLSTALRRLPDARCHAALVKEADELAQGAGVAVA